MNPLDSSLVVSVLDALFAATVVGPAVVGYWRGTWNLMGHYVFPGQPIGSSLVSLVLGFAGMLLFCMAQGPIRRSVQGAPRWCFNLASWCYTAVYGFFCVNSWRGAWLIGDMYEGYSVWLILGVTLTAVFMLALLKGLRNISAPPCVVTVDDPDDYFDVPTFFKKSSHRETSLYVLDCLFSVFVVGSLVVVVWRGAWVIADLTVFPEDPSLSALASLALGYGVVVLTFSLQPVMSWACARLQGLWRVLAADLFLFFSFIGTVNVWRSVWQLLDLYFLPEQRVASDWITHAGCLFVLLLLNCGNSVLVRGVYVDAEEPAGECVVLPVHYLRLYFRREKDRRLRKRTAEAQLTKLAEQGNMCEAHKEDKDDEGKSVEDALLDKTTGPVVVIVANNTKNKLVC